MNDKLYKSGYLYLLPETSVQEVGGCMPLHIGEFVIQDILFIIQLT